MKRILIASVLVIGLTTAGGYAYAPGNGGGAGSGGNGMTMAGCGYGVGQEMMDDYRGNDSGYNHPVAAGFARNGCTREQKQKFLRDTVELRKEMYDRRFEYKEAMRNPQTTRQQISKMEKEMIDLRDKIYDKTPQNQEAELN